MKINFGGNSSFYEVFSPEITLIKEFKHWVILLRKKQQTLGSAIIVLKNKKESIAEVKPEEFAEFPLVVKWYEEKVKSKFKAEKFNYLAAMMKDNFVHFHAFPRYSKIIKMFGKEWQDINWPKMITNMVSEEEPEETISKIISEIV